MSQTQYADIIKKHLKAKSWYQLGVSLSNDNFNPFRTYINTVKGGTITILTECLRKLVGNIRNTIITNPLLLQLKTPPTILFDTEWLFRCCVSLRNDRHGGIPQGILLL